MGYCSDDVGMQCLTVDVCACAGGRRLEDAGRRLQTCSTGSNRKRCGDIPGCAWVNKVSDVKHVACVVQISSLKSCRRTLI